MIQTAVQLQEVASETPAVSVIIPAYNAAKYFREALESVLNQTLTPHEIIVINDGSPDTDQLERELQPYASQVHYIKQENRGAAAARNVGVSAASGEFLAFLDADDKWSPTFLEEQIQFLKRNDADLVYADALLTGQSPAAGRTFMQVQPSRGEVTAEKLLTVEVTVLTSTVLARKQAILEAGLFDEALRRGQDFDLWFRLAKRGARMVYQREVLAEHRIVESGLSGDAISQLERALSVFERIRAKGELTPSEEAALQGAVNVALSKVALENGKEMLRQKDFDGALNSLRQSMRHQQNWKVSLACLGLKVAPELLWRIYVRRAVPAGNH
jgi:glycosyltransferase involved in cell wall biosynthesis